MKAPKKPVQGLVTYAEVSLALDMIQAGRSDGAIAALISANRTQGSRRVDPAAIANLREGL